MPFPLPLPPLGGDGLGGGVGAGVGGLGGGVGAGVGGLGVGVGGGVDKAVGGGVEDGLLLPLLPLPGLLPFAFPGKVGSFRNAGGPPSWFPVPAFVFQAAHEEQALFS